MKRTNSAKMANEKDELLIRQSVAHQPEGRIWLRCGTDKTCSALPFEVVCFRADFLQSSGLGFRRFFRLAHALHLSLHESNRFFSALHRHLASSRFFLALCPSEACLCDHGICLIEERRTKVVQILVSLRQEGVDRDAVASALPSRSHVWLSQQYHVALLPRLLSPLDARAPP